MRKIAILVIFLALASLALIPFAIGYEFKNRTLAFFDALNAANAQAKVDFKFTILEYQLGWLHSNAKIELRSQMMVIDNETKKPTKLPLVVVIDNVITHGPLIQDPFTNAYILGMANIKSTSAISSPRLLKATANVAEIDTVVDLHQKWHGQFNQGQAHMPIGDFAELSIASLKGHFNFNTDKNIINEFKFNFDVQSFVMKAKPSNSDALLQELAIDTIHYEHQGSLEAAGLLWTGDTKVTIPKITAIKSNKSTIVLDGFEANSTVTTPNQNLFSFNLKLALAHLQTANDLLPTLGPLNLSFAAADLNGNGLQDLANFFKDHNGPLSPEDRITYLGLLPKVFTATSKINQDFTAQTPDGAVKDDALLSFKSAPANLQELPEAVNTAINLHVASALVDKLILAYDGPAPLTPQTAQPAASTKEETAAKQKEVADPATPAAQPAEAAKPTVRQVLDSWLQKGLVIREGSDYVMAFKYENGVTTVNGKTPE